jgi:peroxiredoxin
MNETPTESLHRLLAELHAHRVATWRPEDLQVNIDQRQRLVDAAQHARFIEAGDVIEPFRVPDVDGGIVDLDGLLENGPAVLIFFRFAGCPACNIALAFYQRRLLPQLRSLGASLLALSPQIPDRLLDIKQRHGLEFTVATDLNNELGRQFGILYTFDEASQRAALARGSPIGDVTGTGTWELPMPTAIVVDRSRVVRFVDVAPDWLVRTEVEPIIDAVRAIRTENTDSWRNEALAQSPPSAQSRPRAP